MVQQFFDYGQINAQPRHAGRDGAANVVKNPRRDVGRHKCIELPLDYVVTPNLTAAGNGENEFRTGDPRQGAKDLDSPVG